MFNEGVRVFVLMRLWFMKVIVSMIWELVFMRMIVTKLAVSMTLHPFQRFGQRRRFFKRSIFQNNLR